MKMDTSFKLRKGKSGFRKKLRNFRGGLKNYSFSELVGMGLRQALLAVGWYEDREWQGKIIEWYGNSGNLDGLTFSLDSPEIPLAIKSRFFFGKKIYEDVERELIRKFLLPDVPVIELGGGLGIVASIINRKLANPALHVVVEANPNLLPVIEKNRNLNHGAFSVKAAALGYGSSSTDFFLHDSFLDSSAQSHGPRKIAVPTVSLRGLLDEKPWDKFQLVMDIEGGEFELIRREADLIGHRARMIFVEWHDFTPGEDRKKEATRLLENKGFKKVHTRRDVEVFIR